ncbi:replication factor A protein 2 [Podospora aff. communis PSN243]|uniref:Replication factor A protein 2 n=1 Tax=Podospora aff. communis PSN243 TaxID=3040156 RepID=A0AAV9H0K2_9PEZI|nr:replication factor A protein 2 [Podospora aff. communis PSN243]
MSAYGGFAKTSYGAQGGDDGGGFMGGGTQQGSQGGGSKFADDTLRPVTIKQLIESDEPYPGAGLSVDGIPITQVTLIGQVRSIKPQATNVTYQIDDGTGVIDVKKWLDAERADGGANATFQPDTYVRVFGRLTQFNSKKHVGAHFIRQIEDFNEVSYHLLDATYVHLYLTKGASGGGAGAGGDAGGDGMFVDGGNGAARPAGGVHNARLKQCSRNAQTVFNYMQRLAAGDEGANVQAIAQGTGLAARDVIAAADDLLGQGLIYTTLDDETWAVLDY